MVQVLAIMFISLSISMCSCILTSMRMCISIFNNYIWDVIERCFSLNTSKKYPRFLIHFILQILQISMLLISSKLKQVAKYPHICTPITECSFQSVRHCVIRGIVMNFWFSSLCIRTYNHGGTLFLPCIWCWDALTNLPSTHCKLVMSHGAFVS